MTVVPPALLQTNPRHYRRAAVIGFGLLAVAELLLALSNFPGPLARGVVLWPGLHAVWCALLLCVALWMKPETFSRTSVRSLMVALAVVPTYAVVWSRHAELAASTMPWAPFQGIKLISLGLGSIVFAPYWLHAALILGFAVESVALWRALSLATQANVAGVNEPLFTIMFSAVALGILGFRWQRDVFERRMLAYEMRAAFVTRLGQLFLQVRDQCNTPLQTLKAGLKLLEQEGHVAAETRERMTRAVARLAALNEEFSRYEKGIEWTGKELEPEQQEEFHRWLTGVEQETSRNRPGPLHH